MDKGEAMEEVKHTAGPWQAMGTHICAGEFDEFVADCNSESDKPTDAKLDRANAARIVQCCNSHDGLVEAAEKNREALLNLIAMARPHFSDESQMAALDEAERAVDATQAALAKARQP